MGVMNRPTKLTLTTQCLFTAHFMRSSVSGPYDLVGGIIMSFTFDYVNVQWYSCWGDSFTLKRTYERHDGVIMSRRVGMIKLGLLTARVFAL